MLLCLCVFCKQKTAYELRMSDGSSDVCSSDLPVHLQSYEALQRDAEGAIRALLDACGLPFYPACLQFQDARRSVRTASAAQVRQPLQADTGRTGGYGPLLDPLRAALDRTSTRLNSSH